MNVLSFYTAALFLLLLTFSCKNKFQNPLKLSTPDGQVNVSLKKNATDSYVLVADLNGRIETWKIPYPVYQFESGDLDGDHSDDILVGVIKITRFDSICRKRLFIFRLTEGRIRPLWLGSRVGQPLEMFHLCRSDSLLTVLTIEKERDGKYLVAQYKWKGFGLSFIKYISREITKNQAYKLLYRYEEK